LTCLDFEKIQREEALDLPPLPPQGRNWKGSVVAPFAGNNMLVLYQCPSKISDGSTISGDQNNSYFIQVLHNEAPVSMPVRLITSLLVFVFSSSICSTLLPGDN
jgi:multiple inositol-polyphosphate phosphatase/2,3-bisphosphoglycerate 3-phosphatase